MQERKPLSPHDAQGTDSAQQQAQPVSFVGLSPLLSSVNFACLRETRITEDSITERSLHISNKLPEHGLEPI